MAVTFDELKAMVEEAGVKFFADPQKETILLGFSGTNGIFTILLKRVEDGEGVFLRVPGVAMVKDDHPFKAKALEILLTENHQVKVGRFCYDPQDGEVYVDWFLPLEDGTLTLSQLRRCIMALLHMADEMTLRLRHVLETGEDLPSEEFGLKGMVQRLLREGIRRGLFSEEAEVRLRRLLEGIEGREEGDETS